MKPETRIGYRRDVYQEVTDTIVAALERGDIRPWARPWRSDRAAAIPLRHNGIPYRGVNVLLLWLQGVARGYKSPYWMSLRQANALGGRVMKGEKSTSIVFTKTYMKDEGTDDERTVSMLRYYGVFNVEQIEGLGTQYVTPAIPEPTPGEPVPGEHPIHALVAQSLVKLHQGPEYTPMYIPSTDTVCIPPPRMFTTWHHYVSTLLHEMVHWTGHASRLDRDAVLRPRFGSEAYGMEELVAEIGAGYAGSMLGVYSHVRDDNVSYIASWIRTLRTDSRAIFFASTRAQMAADYLLDFIPGYSVHTGDAMQEIGALMEEEP